MSLEKTFVGAGKIGVKTDGLLAVFQGTSELFYRNQTRRSVAENGFVRLDVYSVGIMLNSGMVIAFFELSIPQLFLLFSLFLS